MVIPLRRRGPGDAYEVNPEMWRGGGRFVGEGLRSRSDVELGGADERRRMDTPPAYMVRDEIGRGSGTVVRQ